LCKYSIGSSTVTICTLCSLFILSIIAARVVDLPLPVGPVTNINPLGLLQKVSAIGGNPNASNFKISKGILLKAPAIDPL